MSATQNHKHWMEQALNLARKAGKLGEVPVAALVVGPEGLIAWAINSRERKQTPLGHAETVALHKAAQKRKNWRLEDCTLYVTLEPCLMCAGAIQQARIKTVVYGAKDPKAGAVDSLYHVLQDARLNHQCEVISGIQANESSLLLQDFFKKRRQDKKEEKQNIIYRERAEALILHENKILVVHLEDPLSKKKIYTLPGGAIDDNESAHDAALRETREETGYDVELVPNLSVSKTFSFTWKGALRPCRTQYFLGKLKNTQHSPHPVNDADYNKGFMWMDVSQVLELWTPYPEAKAAVQKLLKKRSLLATGE